MGNTEIVSKEFREKYKNYTPSGAYNYITPITEKQPGETPIYRNPKTPEKLISYVNELKTLKDLLLYQAKKLSTKPYLGQFNSKDKQFYYKTYEQSITEMSYIGSGILNLSLLQEDKVDNLKVLGIFSQTREEFQILDQASCLYGFQTVAIYETLQNMGIEHILKETQITTLFCSAKQIQMMATIKDLHNLKTIVSFDQNIEMPKTLDGIKLIYWQDILNAGKEKVQDFAEILPETIYTICYTSGTTGTPKGAIISHKNMVATISGTVLQEYYHFFKDEDGTYFAFLPLAHSFGKMAQWLTTIFNCKIAFFSGDMRNLKNEMMLVKPTFIIGVPRIFSRIFEAIKGKLDEKTGLTKILINKAIDSKKQSLKNHVTYSDWMYDKLIFNKCKEAFGGKLKLVLNGSAPLSTEQLEFLKISLCIPVYNAYGATENAAGVLLTSALDFTSGTVGGPTLGCEVKLIDVPEMNYTSDDKDEFGNPSPRGELCIRGDNVIKGYYKNPEETKKIIDDDGWLHSGDIAQIKFDSHVNGGFYIIDRRKNIFKLSQGEYIAPEKLEMIYSRNKYIADIFVYGNSFERYLISVISPNKVNLVQYAKDHNIEGSFQQLCEDPQIIKLISEELNSEAQTNNLIGYEFIKKFYLTSITFQEEDILTPSLKLMRHKAKQRYEDILNKLYDELAKCPTE